MGILIIYHGYNNPMYNVHKNMSAHYTQQNTVITTESTTNITRFMGKCNQLSVS